jgi:hypothetical protein
MAPLLVEESLSFSDDVNAIDDRQKSICFAPLHCVNTSKIINRRCVSFGAVTSTHEIIHHKDLSKDEIKNAWYNREDMRRMKVQARSDAKLLESGLIVDINRAVDDDLCIRGLESRTRSGGRRKKHNRSNAYAAVFLEIDCQHEEGFFDVEAIADAYFMYSDQCQVSAQIIGTQDEIDANGSHKTDFNFCESIGASNLLITEGLTISAAA